MRTRANVSGTALAAAARLAAAAVAAFLLCWVAWWTARAGASRLYSSFGVLSRSAERVALAASLAPSDPEAHFARAWVSTMAGDLETADVGRRILKNERQTAEKITGTWDHVTDLSLREAGAAA